MVIDIYPVEIRKALKRILFHERNRRSYLKERKKIKSFLSYLFKDQNKNIEKIDIIFCSDDFLLDLNNSFLNHDSYTDTLTFLMSENENLICGEIYISIDRVKENSQNLKIPYQQELLRVLIHSCLHLCGFSDISESKKKKMFQIQEKYLNKFVSRET